MLYNFRDKHLSQILYNTRDKCIVMKIKKKYEIKKGKNFMKLEKTNLNIEKLGNISIFSYNGYILGFTNDESLDDMSFFPIVINSKHYDKDKLKIYFNFMSVMSVYNGDSDLSEYSVYLKEYNKVYNNYDKYDVMQLIELSSDCDICITPERTSKIINIIENLMNTFSEKNDKLVTSFIEKDNVAIRMLSLDDDNYIKIDINRLEQHFLSYHSTTDEIDDIVKIFEHIFEMLDKNLKQK